MNDKELEVYNMLEDDESKYIYYKRTEYKKAYNPQCIADIVINYTKEFNIIKSFAQNLTREYKFRKIYLFPAGVRGTMIGIQFQAAGIQIDGYIDNDESKWGSKISGIPVYSPFQVKDIECVVIITLDMQSIIDEMKSQIKNLFKNAKIEVLNDFISSYPYPSNQYFDNLIHLEENEVFIDGGVFDLGSTLNFIERCKEKGLKNYKSIAFEPNKEQYLYCKKQINDKSIENVELINKGLWDKEDILYFSPNGAGSFITEEKKPITISVTSIDQYVNDEITFIKLDVEGAELETLKGGEETIRRVKPKLAVCIYHKPNDLVDIPMFIKKVVPEYKLYVRHYSVTNCETVLYAVIDRK